MDFVFRVLGMEYNGRTDFVHVKPVKQERAAQPTLPGLEAPAAAPKFTPVTSAAESASDYDSKPLDGANQMYASLMGDAPACSTCGHTTVRNGACYRCMNCGNSMGCS